MSIDWNAIQKAVIPIKSYEDLFTRVDTSFKFSFVREIFNFKLGRLVEYIHKSLGGDLDHRYGEYEQMLTKVCTAMGKAGIGDVLALLQVVKTRQSLEDFFARTGFDPLDVVQVFKFLIYWFVPGEKYLSGLIQADPQSRQQLEALRAIGIRTNLELLERGRSKTGRASMAKECGLPEAVVETHVNRADLSRMPWASKATIANILGAGYGSLAELADAVPEKLYADFYRYGESIGKNLKHGNEIENSHRIAKIVPRIVQ